MGSLSWPEPATPRLAAPRPRCCRAWGRPVPLSILICFGCPLWARVLLRLRRCPAAQVDPGFPTPMAQNGTLVQAPFALGLWSVAPQRASTGDGQGGGL